MRGFRRDSDDDDSTEDLAAAAARFGIAVAEDAVALRALPPQAQSMSLDEWLASSRNVRGRVADCVVAMLREIDGELPAGSATEWAVSVAAAALQLDDDDTDLLRESVADRLAEAS